MGDMAMARARNITAQHVWPPRFVAYATAHGKTPQAMIDADSVQWPTRRMTGYTLWLDWAWKTWDEFHQHGPSHVRTDEEEKQFTEWLTTALGVTA